MPSDIVHIASADRNSDDFIQNGQVDWVAFGKSIWSTSSVVLQRFASAGVQPITFGAGLALASRFDLDRIGKQRMHSALDRIQGMWSFEKILWFGFGARSFLHVMADAQSGVNCIALCSALGEVHDEHAAAWILDELWKVYDFPQQFLPSHSQFTALVKACSGVLTRSEFGLTLDRMLGHTLDPKPNFDMSSVEDTANAMRGLFRTSKKDFIKINVIGGAECAFIAGFAQWILNLNVYVEDEAGQPIHQDTNIEEAQVVVTYRRQADLSLVQISSVTYIIRDNDEMLLRTPTLDQILLTIRTPWEHCLIRVFGNTFAALTRAPIIFGGFLGSVARVYRALALAERDVGNFSRKTYFNFVETSYGIGYINAVITIFPELKLVSGLFDEMQSALDSPLKDATRTVERSILDLEQLCQCRLCKANGRKEIDCIVVLALSIREMVSTLSSVTMDKDISPTIRGLRLVYVRHSADWPFPLAARERPLLAIALGLCMEGVYGPDADDIRHVDLLSRPIEILSGLGEHSRYRPENQPSGTEHCTATVKRGLCYYLNCLRSLSSHAENARMIFIIPGHIQMGDKQFNNVFDAQVSFEPAGHRNPIEFHRIEGNETRSLVQQPLPREIKLELLCIEKSRDHELAVFYRATIPGEPAATLRPGHFSYLVLKGTGILTCERSHCTPRLILPCALIRRGWCVSDNDDANTWINSRTGHICFIWPQLEDPERCIAISEQWSSSVEFFFRRGECTSCCTISLVRERPKENRKELFHVF